MKGLIRVYYDWKRKGRKIGGILPLYETVIRNVRKWKRSGGGSALGRRPCLEATHGDHPI